MNLKEEIRDYMRVYDVTLEEMAIKLGMNNRQHLHEWLNTVRKSATLKILDNFLALRAKASGEHGSGELVVDMRRYYSKREKIMKEELALMSDEYKRVIAQIKYLSGRTK